MPILNIMTCLDSLGYKYYDGKVSLDFIVPCVFIFCKAIYLDWLFSWVFIFGTKFLTDINICIRQLTLIKDVSIYVTVYLVRIFGCGNIRDKAGVLPVEVDEDERSEYHDAHDTVAPECGSCSEVAHENSTWEKF